jgi:hypothetical protein
MTTDGAALTNLRRIAAEARVYASTPCVLPLTAAGGE